ncbi:MAG: BMP family ABC transporter substrate-binding protein [Clostridia bacterium]|nr:BMP family ABC transporter substrate-binding protein [Clostridia bacterium]
MSRTDAIEQYVASLRQGKKYFAAATARKEDPYPRVLEEILSGLPATGEAKVGLIDIPMERIVGTWAAGRKTAFAGNFMPLLDPETEFAQKWIALCEAHLDAGGITDAITCFEYMGEFYVQEGHKRVSVLKSYSSPTISAVVTRVIPPAADTDSMRVYNEFVRFFKASRTYVALLTRPGGYARLQAAMGLAPDQVWDAEIRHTFETDYRRFAALYEPMNAGRLPLTAGDALVAWLEVHPYSDLRALREEALSASLSALFPDLRLMASGEHISVATEPEKKEKGLLGRILGAPRLHAAFIYDTDPRFSPWASAHEQGQLSLAEAMGDEVHARAYVCEGNVDAAMEQAVADGANVIFATTPPMIDACRRLAANHKNVAVYNCSLSMPYTGVRSYYCRVYESKFIAGAVAGAVTTDRRIGFVAKYPIMGTLAGVNAFALGVRMTNPKARVLLRWRCLPGDPVQDLLDEGVHVISNRDEDSQTVFSGGPIGTYRVGAQGALHPLVMARWNWGVFYEKTARSLLSGGISAVRDGSHAINDWWGMDTGMVSVDLDDGLPDGVRQLALLLRDGIIAGSIDPFLCRIRTQDGETLSDGTRVFSLEERMRMDWLCDNVEGSVPAFDELLPMSRPLVRVLGIYREDIPPQTEESAR